jgi:peptidoglycan/xylan/chitin deacetylase (PgdA/CDA1 family)
VALSALARRGIKVVAASVDRVRPPARGIVVLIYHRVGAGTGVEVDLPAALFDEQLGYLRARGPVVTLDTALELVAGQPVAADPVEGPDPVVITFDDGTADFVDVAVPILERHGVPALLYAATAFVDDGRSFPDEGRPASWSGLRDAVSTGLVTVGSHTHNHALLDRIPAATAADELDRSVDRIGAELGAAPRHFAYPKAVAPSPEVEELVRSRFASAALAGTRPNPYGATDPHRLARTPVQVSDAMRWFAHKADGGMALEDRLRQMANRRRYADATQ